MTYQIPSTIHAHMGCTRTQDGDEMSERAKSLLMVIAKAGPTHPQPIHADGVPFARAICEHLGMEVLRETVSSLRWTASAFSPGTMRHQQWTARADAIATLLEAAGIPEPTPDLTHRPGRAI